MPWLQKKKGETTDKNWTTTCVHKDMLEKVANLTRGGDVGVAGSAQLVCLHEVGGLSTEYVLQRIPPALFTVYMSSVVWDAEKRLARRGGRELSRERRLSYWPLSFIDEQ